MKILRWLKGFLSHRGKALALYRSGMTKANRKDFEGAITDYSAVIDSLNAPPNVKAMAVYNRALAYSAIHQDENAAKDLDAVLKMPHLSEDVKTAARRRKERVRKREQRET